MGEVINFAEFSGWIKGVEAARRAAETVGPTNGDCCVMDPTYYPDPSLAEYIASAGYPTSDGEPIA